MTIECLKKLGKDKTEENFEFLLELYDKLEDVTLKRECASSIGRYYKVFPELVLDFVQKKIFEKDYMDVVYQLYRTLLANYSNEKYKMLADEVEKFYNNEVMQKMKNYRLFKKSVKPKRVISDVKKPLLLEGDSGITLQSLKAQSVQMIFTSPPYYNARIYSDYTS